MPLRVACQMDPIDRIDIRGDSTFALLLEAQRRGHALFYYTPPNLALHGGRLIARGTTPKPGHLAETGSVTDPEAARRGTRAAYWGDGFVDTPVYDGAQLGAGATIEGPALIEEPFTVVVLPPGATATLDALGNYLITV